MNPVVRLMVPCEDVQARDNGAIDILGVMSILDSPIFLFPVEIEFCVYLSLANGRGSGIGKIIVVNEETGESIHSSEEHAFHFGQDPMVLVATRFYVHSCIIPSPGIFRLDFVYNGSAIGSCIIQVREEP